MPVRTQLIISASQSSNNQDVNAFSEVFLDSAEGSASAREGRTTYKKYRFLQGQNCAMSLVEQYFAEFNPSFRVIIFNKSFGKELIMKHKHYLLSLIAAWATQSSAMNPNDKVVKTYFSQECGPVDYQVVDFGTGPSAEDGQIVTNEALEIGFVDFGLGVSEPGRRSIDCQVQVDIEIPARMKFRAVAAYAEGTYSLAHNARADIRVDYSINDGYSAGVCDKQNLSGADQFKLQRRP